MRKTGVSGVNVNVANLEELTAGDLNRREGPSGNREIESALKEHSKFLSSMRYELNRKLYKLRGTTHY